MSVARDDPGELKGNDEPRPIDEWARLKSGLSKVCEEYLKANGYTWKAFRALEKAAKDEAMGLQNDVIQTDSGIVQIVRKKAYAVKRGAEISTEVRLHFITKEE